MFAVRLAFNRFSMGIVRSLKLGGGGNSIRIFPIGFLVCCVLKKATRANYFTVLLFVERWWFTVRSFRFSISLDRIEL